MVKVHFNWQMVKNLMVNLMMEWLMVKDHIQQLMDKLLGESGKKVYWPIIFDSMIDTHYKI